MKSRILEDLIRKCNASSLRNVPGSGDILPTLAVIRSNGKSLADDPTLNANAITLYTGNNIFALTIVNLPEGTEVTYESSNTSVAIVDEEGNVTYVNPGTCNVTASYTDENGETVTFTCNVTCSEAVALVDSKEFVSIEEAVEYAMLHDMPLEPVAEFVSFTFESPEQKLKINKVYEGAEFELIPCENTESHVYEVASRRVESEIFEYYIADLGSPEFEFTSAITGNTTYFNTGDKFDTPGVYKVLKDVPEMKGTIFCDLTNVGGNILIDLNGHTLTATENTKKTDLERSLGIIDVINADIVIDGHNGSIKCTEAGKSLYGFHNICDHVERQAIIEVDDNVYLIDDESEYPIVDTWDTSEAIAELRNLSILAGKHAVYNENGSVVINGNGRYEVFPIPTESDPSGYGYTLDCEDGSYIAGTAIIEVNGGKFYKFNPGDCISEGEHTNFLGTGHTVSYNSETYTYTVA